MLENIDISDADIQVPILAQYQVVRIRSFWPSYTRILQLTSHSLRSVDPSSFIVKKVFPYTEITNLTADEHSPEHIIIEHGGKTYIFKTSFRTQLLTQIFTQVFKFAQKTQARECILSKRIRKNTERIACKLVIEPYGILELNMSDKALQEYSFSNMTSIGFDKRAMCLYFEYSSRYKVFYSESLDTLQTKLQTQLRRLGLLKTIPITSETSVADVVATRTHPYRSIGATISFFEVNKVCGRNSSSSSRKLFITEKFIVEKDSAGFDFISINKLTSMYMLCRSWENPREFTIDYADGSSRTYTSTIRDTLLATLLDATHALGNTRVHVTMASTDGLRLFPRCAGKEYESSLTFSIFGSSSVELWFLHALAKHCRGYNLPLSVLVGACRDFNANVSYPGLSALSETASIKLCIAGVLNGLDQLLAYVDKPAHYLPDVVTMLQTLHRLIPCKGGYKVLVSITQTDARTVFKKLIFVEDDFVNYWTIEVLLVLVRCPLTPRDLQQEFVNKHTLLTTEILHRLVELMGVRLPLSPEEEEEEENLHEENKSAADETLPEDASPVRPDAYRTPPPKKKSSRVVPERGIPDLGGKVFVPNSLVIISASTLLESVLSSRKDTSSPELVDSILDMLSQCADTLMYMLKSSSSLIVENAAILVHVLLRKREEIAEVMREAALIDGLLLKHLLHGIFSSSANQRFISRFLISIWTSGEGEGKKLLKRILPAGLVEYLKFGPISEDHSENLDQLEQEYFDSLSCYQQTDTDASYFSPIKSRLRVRVQAATQPQSTQQALIDDSEALFHNCDEVTVPNELRNDENFRIMFHAITQNHCLPDLIWNEQTRLELRGSLEQELSDLEREQRRHVGKKIAWNYTQFTVRYESLKEEPRVGPVYVQPFLEAGDSFVVSLGNHAVLFEMFMRRVLVNVDKDPPLAILCAKCLCKLYNACHDKIASFDDMQLLVRMMDQSTSLELQHHVLSLIDLMANDATNLLQFLDRDIVNIFLKFASLAHLNPDQIGNMLARISNKTLLLKAAENNEGASQNHASSSSTIHEGPVVEEAPISRQNNFWIPEDEACPKIWFVSPPVKSLPPPTNKLLGPFRVTDLKVLYARGEVKEDWLVAPSSAEDYFEDPYETVVDTGLWKRIKDYFQLHIQLVIDGDAVSTPSEVALRSISILTRLAALHKATSRSGLEFFPIPTSKRIMSEPYQLAIISQLLLSNESKVVDLAATLLHSLISCNAIACSKLYQSGAFFFGCRYTGNNFLGIASLFAVSHLKQSYHVTSTSLFKDLPLNQQSILGAILPDSLLNALVNYSPEVFTAVFTGHADSPEFIWSQEHRKYLVQMIDQHIGVFIGTIRQYTLASYEYVPLPKIHYPMLEKELYVHEFYLRNLCDEAKFPDWPIADPLRLLSETIERWRLEMDKGIVDVNVAAAKKLLKLDDKYTNASLRTAYRTLARLYHPDKNPNGREMFEAIKKAYEMLSLIQMNNAETDMKNVFLLLQTQNIVYRRFRDKVSDQQYPAYELLVSVMEIPDDDAQPDSFSFQLLEAGTLLIYNTCAASVHNAAEFVQSGSVSKLLSVLLYMLPRMLSNEYKSKSSTFYCCLKAVFIISSSAVGKTALLELCPQFATAIVEVASLAKILPLAAETALGIISNCASLAELQNILTGAGIVWKVIPFILAYDLTVQDAPHNDNIEEYTQMSANTLASLSLRVLGRLGGYMFGASESPKNEPLQAALCRLLTQPLAKLLRNESPLELLHALNENVEKCTKIWNVSMRKELLEFVVKVDTTRPHGYIEDDLAPAMTFSYAALKDEIMIGGVYVRVFVKHADLNDLEDPTIFCQHLLRYIHDLIPDLSDESQAAIEGISETVSPIVVDALRILVTNKSYIARDILDVQYGTDIVFKLLDARVRSELLEPATALIRRLCANPEYVADAAKRYPACAWRLIRFLCLCATAVAADGWLAADGFISHHEGLDAFLRHSGVLYLLGIIFGKLGYCHVHSHRIKAIALLSKLMWNPIKGPDAATTLRRFIPEPLVRLLKGKAVESTLKAFDTTSETPELYWTNDMRDELRSAIKNLLIQDGDLNAGFSFDITLQPEFSVEYKQLSDEIYIGAVYIRLYLKHRTYRLSNPVYFLEQLMIVWENAFNSQVPTTTMQETPVFESNVHHELILAKEDFVSLLTSCIICVLSTEENIADHMISWGYDHRLFSFMTRALDFNRRGIPLICILRLLKELLTTKGTLKHILSNTKSNIMKLLLNSMKTCDELQFEIHKEAILAAEILKIIFQTATFPFLDELVKAALAVQLPQFILDHVLSKELAHVRNASAVKIHCVDALKAMAEAEEFAESIQALLDSHPAWKKYRNQNHALYLTGKDKVDHFLIEDSSDTKFVALLTNVENAPSKKHSFISTTKSPPVTPSKIVMSPKKSAEDVPKMNPFEELEEEKNI